MTLYKCNIKIQSDNIEHLHHVTQQGFMPHEVYCDMLHNITQYDISHDMHHVMHDII